MNAAPQLTGAEGLFSINKDSKIQILVNRQFKQFQDAMVI